MDHENEFRFLSLRETYTHAGRQKKKHTRGIESGGHQRREINGKKGEACRRRHRKSVDFFQSVLSSSSYPRRPFFFSSADESALLSARLSEMCHTRIFFSLRIPRMFTVIRDDLYGRVGLSYCPACSTIFFEFIALLLLLYFLGYIIASRRYIDNIRSFLCNICIQNKVRY